MGNPWGKSGGLGKTWKNRRNMRANLGNYGKTISWENPWKPLYSIPFQYRPLYKVVPASYGSCFGQPPMNYRWTKLFGIGNPKSQNMPWKSGNMMELSS
jgi:hypothetical protein